MAFFYYVSDALYYYPRGLAQKKRFFDMLNPAEEIELDGDTIAKNVIEKLGLKFEE